MTILVVDDNDDARKIVKLTLSAAGFKVSEAQNGAEALEKARQSVPDMIISDILMPVMDGFQLCMAVKNDDRLRGVPFVIYTATYTDAKDMEFAMGIGADAFIRKPEDPDQFMARIQEILSTPTNAKPTSSITLEEDSPETLKVYNQRLINKLEKKIRELETVRAADAVRQKELELIKNLIDQSNDAILVANPKTAELIYFNERACLNLGYTTEELSQKKVTDIQKNLPDMAAWAAFVTELQDNGQIIFEGVHQRKDGSTYPMEASVRFISHGADQYIVGTIRDTTERKTAEVKYIRLATAIEQAAESVIITDTNPKIVYVNPAFERTTGYPGNEVMGKNPRLLQSGTHSPSFYREMWETLTQGKVWRGRLCNRKKDGTLFYEDASISPVFDTTGNTINFVAVKRDVTQELETEKRLLHAQKMEAIGTLAGGIAHDFNNMLASLIGFAELAMDSVEKGSVLEDDLKEIYAAGMRARDLVKQILTFARRSDEDIKPVQVKTIVNEALKFLRASVPASIEFRQWLESDSRIMGSPAQVHQIVMNLCTNAAQVMDKNGGVLTVQLTDVRLDPDAVKSYHHLKPGDYIKLSVSDTGSGIPADILPSIFDPYFTTKAPGEGSGLGLATVHGIVRQWGGEILVDSEIDKGTTFTIYLPITQQRTDVTPDEKTEFPRGREKILFVDDEPAIAKMVGKTLEKLGYRVTVRTGSVEALTLFKSAPEDFDLVITDMTMPTMNGDRLAVELMNIRSDIPVILCTGFTNKTGPDTAKQIGIQAFVHKPFSLADLAKTVRNVLDDAKGKI